MGSSWGGSIVIVDTSSGSIQMEMFEPCMFDGYTGTDAFVYFQWNKGKDKLKLDWKDVVFDSGSYKSTSMGLMGEPGKQIDRELIFSLPDLSTSTVVPASEWSDAESKPLPSAGVDGIAMNDPKAGAPPKLPIEWNEWDSVLIWTKNIFFTWSGYGLNCYEFGSGKKLWSVDFNPMNDPLPGGAPRVKIYEMGNVLVVATDRLGMRALDKASGALLWYLPYGNADVIPEIVVAGDRLILAPAERAYQGPDCMEIAKQGAPPNHRIEQPAAR
jgi:hypothetical protein